VLTALATAIAAFISAAPENRAGRKHGEVNSHIVLSTQYEGRAVEPPAAEARPVTGSSGWSR
jgi:hypothetical protein